MTTWTTRKCVVNPFCQTGMTGLGTDLSRDGREKSPGALSHFGKLTYIYINKPKTMNQFNTFALVVGLLCLIFAVWIRFRAGEKYMKLFCFGDDTSRYDLRKFRVVHAAGCSLVGLCAIWAAFASGLIPILAMLAVLIVDCILILTVCKKDDRQER